MYSLYVAYKFGTLNCKITR